MGQIRIFVELSIPFLLLFLSWMQGNGQIYSATHTMRIKRSDFACRFPQMRSASWPATWSINPIAVATSMRMGILRTETARGFCAPGGVLGSIDRVEYMVAVARELGFSPPLHLDHQMKGILFIEIFGYRIWACRISPILIFVRRGVAILYHK